MTAKVNLAFDSLTTIIESAFSGIHRMANPYQPELNPGLVLTRGYGVAFGVARNLRDLQSCMSDIERDFVVILSRKIVSTQNDATTKDNIAKDIFEDQLALRRAVDQDTTLNQVVADCNWIGDGGIEILETADQVSYFITRNVFTCRYIESLNA